MATETENFLMHFGVKGMHWGVRKDHEHVDLVNDATGNSHTISYNPRKASVKRSEDGKVSIVTSHKGEQKSIQKQIDKAISTDHHADASSVIESRRIARASGTHALSNKDLKKLVERMNLEQQYEKLNPKQISAGKKFVNGAGKGAGKAFGGAAQQTMNQIAKATTTAALRLAFEAVIRAKTGRKTTNGGAYHIVRGAIDAAGS